MTEIIEIIFKNLENENYVIIKHTNFNYEERGYDIDILCDNIPIIRDKIIRSSSSWLNKSRSIKADYENDERLLIDFIENKELIFRLDIYQTLGNYNKIILKDSLKDVILETKEILNLDSYKINVPKKIYDNILRYIEPIENIDIRQDKVKHIKYLKKNIENEALFYRTLHYFIKVPNPQPSVKRRLSKKDIRMIFKKIKQTPINELIPKIIKFFKK